MQHTDILELNSCIAYLRTGKEVSRPDGTNMYDMTWTFAAPRDPTVTELFVGSPGDSAWLPTTADIKAEQQRRAREKEDEVRRMVTPQPVQKPANNNMKELAPVPLSGLKAPIEFKKKRVQPAQQGQRSLLTNEISQAKKGGVVVGAPSNQVQAAPNVPSIKFTIYLPDRRGIELRVAKNATVEQTIVAVLERYREKLGKKKADRFEMRMHDSDGLPDDDFPALDRDSILAEMGSNEFCLCDLKAGEDDSDAETAGEEEKPSATPPPPAATPVPAPLPSSAPALARSKSLGPNSIKLEFEENIVYDVIHKSVQVAPDERRAAVFLKRIVKTMGLPLFAEEYQLRVHEEDRERLGMLTTVVDPNDDILDFGIEKLIVCKRKFADAPPDADQVDLLKTAAGKEAKRVNDGANAGAAGGGLPNPKKSEVGGPGGQADKNQAGQGGMAVVTINEAPHKNAQDGMTTPGNKDRNAAGKTSATKSIKRGLKPVNAVDPESILLNEIKAALYEEWRVIKTNNWGKNQPRILGIDLQKIYNKPQKEAAGFGQSVKHAERLIADVVSIEIHADNPAKFTIKVRDGPGNAIVVLNYEAEGGAKDAAMIVAKVKFNQSGLLPSRY